MKFSYLGGPDLTLGHYLFGWRQGAMQRDHDRVFAENYRDRCGCVACSLLVKCERRFGDLLRYIRRRLLGLFHQCSSLVITIARHG